MLVIEFAPEHVREIKNSASMRMVLVRQKEITFANRVNGFEELHVFLCRRVSQIYANMKHNYAVQGNK